MMSHPNLVPPHAVAGEQLLSRSVAVLSVTQIKGAFYLAHVQLDNGRFGDVPCDADVTSSDAVGLYSRLHVRNGRLEAGLRVRRLQV